MRRSGRGIIQGEMVVQGRDEGAVCQSGGSEMEKKIIEGF
jgi:hypothetical protein